MLASVVIVQDSVIWIDVVTAAAVVIGVSFAGLQLRRQARIAESEHLMGMLRRWSEKPLQDARHLVDQYSDSNGVLTAMEGFEKTHDEREFVLLRILAFYEDLGILARDMKVIQVKSVRNSLASSVAYYWERFELVVLDLRQKQEADGKKPTAYAWFENLKNKIS